MKETETCGEKIVIRKERREKEEKGREGQIEEERNQEWNERIKK